jgi:predicted transcriptional regulator
LPDVQTATLQPEILTPHTSVSNDPTPIIAPSEPVIEPKQEELLLTTDEEEHIEQVSNRCAEILEDLNDLQFEQQEEFDKEKEEFNLIKQEVDEAASK